eukprot:gene734-993_t
MPLGNVEPAQQRASFGLRLFPRHAIGEQRLGHHVERSDPRHRAQELADIADGVTAHAENLPRLGVRRHTIGYVSQFLRA